MGKSKLIKISVTFLCLFLFNCFTTNEVYAFGNEKIDTYSVETYTRNVTIGLGIYGSVDAQVDIRHNITTGKSYVLSVKHEDKYSYKYKLNISTISVTTNPKVGSYFSGSIRLSLILKYKVSGNVHTETRYIQL